MVYFQCDYLEGCHPKLLDRLLQTNELQAPGYGKDPFCDSARQKIRCACGAPDADVHFLVGGTQTNLVAISSVLRCHQGVISADEGHIAGHEAGAIEATGHKVLTLPSEDGKITAAQIASYFEDHILSDIREHMVQPGMVYISFPTESGTLYSKQELEAISQVCRRYQLPLYLDGARLGYGLTSPANDVTLEDLAALCDAFYIGGTKCGALFGEALVITNDSLKKDFRYCIKQRGAMLAKGRLLGLQFDALFTDNLYFEICSNALQSAFAIRKAFQDKGISMFGTSQTNQQFPILKNTQLPVFDGKFVYEVWAKPDSEHTIVRFCTSWATKQCDVEDLITAIQTL